MTDDQIASLDSRWDVFPESEQAALKATRILTIRPFAFGDREVADLKKHFNDAQVIDILYTVARYNASTDGRHRRVSAGSGVWRG